MRSAVQSTMVILTMIDNGLKSLFYHMDGKPQMMFEVKGGLAVFRPNFLSKSAIRETVQKSRRNLLKVK